MSLWSKLMGNEEGWRTLSARVLEAEHERYAELAKLRGMSLSAFVREAMSVMYPQELFEEQKLNLREQTNSTPNPDPPSGDPDPSTLPVAPPSQVAGSPEPAAVSVMGFGAINEESMAHFEDGLSAALAALDAHEAGRVSLGTVHGAPPAKGVIETRHGTTVPGGPPVRNDGHPCKHLNVVPPAGHTRADCQGSCYAQPGRPCHWPAGMAASCTHFRPIVQGLHK